MSRGAAALTALAAAGLCFAAPAAAEPVPLPPAPPPPLPTPAPVPALPGPSPSPTAAIGAVGNVLGQTGSQSTGPFGLPDLTGLGPSLILGQNAVPALPGTPAAAVPDLRVFTPDYLLPQNQDPAAPGQGTIAPGIGPNEDIPGTGRIAFLRRLYEMYQAGDLRGGLLGQMPPEEFDAALMPPMPPG